MGETEGFAVPSMHHVSGSFFYPLELFRALDWEIGSGLREDSKRQGYVCQSTAARRESISKSPLFNWSHAQVIMGGLHNLTRAFWGLFDSMLSLFDK